MGSRPGFQHPHRFPEGGGQRGQQALRPSGPSTNDDPTTGFLTKAAARRKPVSTATGRRIDRALEQSSGNFALIDTLRKWGITFFSGVNGGGLIHVAKHLEPVS